MPSRPIPLLFALALTWLIAWTTAEFWPVGDRWLLDILYAGDAPKLAGVARAFTDLGAFEVLLPLTLAAAVVLLARGQRRDAAVLLVITLGGRVLVELQKLAIGRLRPELPHLDPVQSFSFPSGHSANAMITALALALLLSRSNWAVAAALAFAFLIGCTRMMLGVHWPTDVLGGWAFGGFWVVATMRLLRAT